MVLFHAISLAIGVVALYLEILAVAARRSFATALGLAMATWLTSMGDPVSSSRFCSDLSGFRQPLETRNSNLGRLGGLTLNHAGAPG